MAKRPRPEADLMNLNSNEVQEIAIEVKAPTVVMSVRMDDRTARQLHRLAKQRGVRVSDVLRDAAVEYARTGWSEGESNFEIVGPNTKVIIGQRRVVSDSYGETVVSNEPTWSIPRTGLAAARG